MEYRRLGQSGLHVSVAGLGCNNFGMRIDYEAAERVTNAALDAGVTLFDTADVYGQGASEEMLGRALAGRRHEVLIATKFAIPMGDGPMRQGGSRHWITEACEASLRRLGTDYIDLYQMHIPDTHTPIEETLQALDDLVRAGKVRYLGNSNFKGWQISEAHWTADKHHLTKMISAQNHYNLIERSVETEVVPAANRYGLGILPYFPLASGFLTGKYRPGEETAEGTRLAAWGDRAGGILTEKNFLTLERLEAWAGDRGHTVLELAIGWLASQPHVASVISGATKPEQLQANVSAVEWKLTPEEIAEVVSLVA
ncbi:MAG TPA: aldo/keto reductase [Dehalococcoidia bacterium]|nr:aldo/keto reductase [Dehalococcoidia bacterium]